MDDSSSTPPNPDQDRRCCPAVLEVLDHATATGTTLLILLGIARWAEPDGTAFPGYRVLARLARLKSPSTVAYHVRKLVASGELIVVERGGGRGHPNRYAIAVGRWADRAGDNAGETRESPELNARELSRVPCPAPGRNARTPSRVSPGKRATQVALTNNPLPTYISPVTQEGPEPETRDAIAAALDIADPIAFDHQAAARAGLAAARAALTPEPEPEPEPEALPVMRTSPRGARPRATVNA